MVKIKKLVGSVMSVFRYQGRPESCALHYEHNLGYEVNKRTITKDMDRISLVDFSGKTFDDFAAEVLTPEVYGNHYKQGNIDGAGPEDIYREYNESIVASKYSNIEKLRPESEEYEAASLDVSKYQDDWLHMDSKRSLRFAYRDDDGVLCSFSLVYNIKFPNKWVMQIDRNTIAPLEKRKTALFFTDGGFIIAGVGTDVALDELPEELEKALTSRILSKLLSGLFNADGTPSQEKHEKLKQRILSNQNIDNRDVKVRQLSELFESVQKHLPNDLVIQANIQDIRDKMSQNPDFFEETQYNTRCDEFLKDVYDTLSDLPSPIKERSKYEVQLTKYAIELDNLSYISVSKYAKVALSEQARALRAKRDDASSVVEELELSSLIHQSHKIALLNEFEDKRRKYETNLNNFRLAAGSGAEKALVDSASALLEEAKRRVETGRDTLSADEMTWVNQVVWLCTQVVNDKSRDLGTESVNQFSTLTVEDVPEYLKPLSKLLNNLQQAAFNVKYQPKFDEIKSKISSMSLYANQSIQPFLTEFSDFLKKNQTTLSTEMLSNLNELLNKYSTWLGKINHTAPLQDFIDYLSKNSETPGLTALLDTLQKNVWRLPTIVAYEKNLIAFREANLLKLGDANGSDDVRFYEQGASVIDDIEAIVNGNPSRLYQSNLMQLNQVLECCIKGIKTPADKENIAALAELSCKISGHESPRWKKLGAGLLVFAGLALIAAGILAAIPSGFTSLLLVVLGAAGVGVGTAAGIAAGTVAASAAAGLGFFNRGSKSGLAESVSNYRASIVNQEKGKVPPVGLVVVEPSPSESPVGVSSDSGAGSSPTASPELTDDSADDDQGPKPATFP